MHNYTRVYIYIYIYIHTHTYIHIAALPTSMTGAMMPVVI